MIRKFMSLQPTELQDVFSYYKTNLASSSQDQQSITSALVDYMVSRYGFTPQASAGIAAQLLPLFNSEAFTGQFEDVASPDAVTHAYVTEKDLEFYNLMTSGDENITMNIRYLIVALMVVYRLNYHEKGWVRYDRNEIFYLAGLSSLPQSEQEKLTKYLHESYDFDMQVVGSNNPTPCYMFKWMYDQDLSNADSVDLGPLTPMTIQAVASNISMPRT